MERLTLVVLNQERNIIHQLLPSEKAAPQIQSTRCLFVLIIEVFRLSHGMIFSMNKEKEAFPYS